MARRAGIEADSRCSDSVGGLRVNYASERGGKQRRNTGRLTGAECLTDIPRFLFGLMAARGRKFQLAGRD